jgi:hypothetical protein
MNVEFVIDTRYHVLGDALSPVARGHPTHERDDLREVGDGK